MNYQLANNPSLNLEKKDLIQKLISKNLRGNKIVCTPTGTCTAGTGIF